MLGAHGQVLHVDLTTRTTRVEVLDPSTVHRYIGGKGIGTWLLLRENAPGVDPLSPGNHLVFATGPLTDTQVFGSARHGVFTRSPQTGIYLESYAGGTVADPMSRTGYDAIVLGGACDAPVVLEVTEGAVRYHDAAPLWGLETYAAEDAVRAMAPPKAGITVIGPAGERLLPFAVAENDYWRSCGRGGVGAVLGSKKVKGIFFHGQAKKPLADPDLLARFWKETGSRARENASAMAYRKFGTPMVVAMTNRAGAFPTRYWSAGTFDRWPQITAEALNTQCEVTPKACPRCFFACGRHSQVREGRHAGLVVEGPEYETINAFGGLCLVDDIREILYLNDICDRQGMDTITAGNLAGFAIEASHRKDLGFRIEYGDVDAIAALLGQVARGEGPGAVLCQGIRHASREWGLEDLAIHTKGMEPPGYEPRSLKGMGLAYATSDRGACHLRATFYKPELAGLIPPDQVEGKAQVFTEWEDRLTLQDAFILCRFFRDTYLWDAYSLLLKGTLGLDLDKAGLRVIAADILDLARQFNRREGLRLTDDILPARMHREALADSGKTLPEAELRSMVDEYHKLRGWSD